MGVLFLAVAFCIINIALWVVFLSKFKKLFTADDIIADYQKELRGMTADVDQHASRTIALIEDSEKELRALIAEAERRIALARTELEKQEQSKALLQKLNAKKPAAASRRANPYGKDAEASYALTSAGKRQSSAQVSLFDSAQEEQDRPEVLQPNLFTVDRNGSAYASVPVITPSVSFADNPIRPKKDFSEQVRELAAFGHSVEEIARVLERSTTEVQFILDMGD
ncbi:MAG: hypothetical protein K6G80_05745 [Treponema sp.]|nr:hypothetical protein [Treponema sp.]